MSKKRTKWSRRLCLLLAVCLLAAVLPADALAVEIDYEVEPIAGGFLRVNRYTGVLVNGANLSGNLVIPDNVQGVKITSIADRAFMGFEELTSVTVPATVESIGDQAFYGCSALSSVTIPSSVKTLGDQVFTSCVSLKNVSLGEGLTSLGKNAFRYCYGLGSITLPSSLKTIDSYAFDRCLALKSISVPSGVTALGSNAFSDCTNLTSVSLPSTVNSIGEYCFSGCTALQQINLPSGLASVPTAAFNGCTALEKLIVPQGAQRVEGLAFRGCQNLRQLSLPDSLQSIAGNAFDGCQDLTFYVNAGSLAQAFAAANGIKFTLGTLDGSGSSGGDTQQYPDTPFTDDKKHWAKNAIAWAYAKNYIKGMSASEFGPDITLNRAMFTTMLYNMEGSPAVGSSSFSDVPATAFYAKAVAWAESTKVVSGVGGGKFAPTRNITREQLATMLYNYAVYKQKNLSVRGDLSQFKDNDQISSYAGTSVAWAVGSAIVSGMGGSRLEPKGNATRAQAATMLMKFSTLQ